MELTEAQKNRRQEFLDWPVETALPEVIGSYRFRRADRQEGRVYTAFEYVSGETGWTVRAIFDEETMDYMVKMDFRLFSMTDIELISGDFSSYKESVERLLAKHMQRELIDRDRVSVVIRGKAFTAWDFHEALPETVGGYRRMVAPDRPLLGLNGSYIIAVYENRDTERGIIFFYNMYRNEYYAEMNARHIPIIIHEYDAETVSELEAHIRKRLAGDLERLDAMEPEA